MNDEQHIKLEKYFRTEMSKEELKSFKKDLMEDVELREAFQLYALTAGLFRSKEVQAFRNECLSPAPSNSQRKTTRYRVHLFWTIAASMLLIVGLAFWLYNYIPGKQGKELFLRYNKISELYPRIDYALIDEGVQHKAIIGSDDFEQSKLDGLTAFKSQKWEASISYLLEYLENAHPSDDLTIDEINIMNLYIGRAYLEIEQTDKAIEFLEKANQGVIDLVNYGLIKELIQWQLILAFLKDDDLKNVKRLSLQLKNAQHKNISIQVNNLLNNL